ncbi:carbamoyltransferase family protein [Streptomyces violascens]|uniref:carbamoyltransferase family protein n=1 Tax=Streptomyces violascens TaxID=67381 RepID=UPI00167190F5|nr:carbamoyltransferase C-terminal domain-containing protein [Streptomyces violascens]GGU37977.1 carbamoyltransferase [Streptomyces violascens]
MTAHTPVVVGINLGHDGGAALITDTTMVAIGEERLNRTRYSPGWQASLLYCLRAADIRLEDVDLLAVSGIGHHPPTADETALAHLGVDLARIVPVDHHLSHAYTAYCLSPHDEATVLVVDGGGNNHDTETYYAATRDGIHRLGGNPPTRPRAGGIGATYEAFTNWLGWHEQEAGKTMALASYGDPHAHPAPLFDVTGATVHGRLTLTHAAGVAELARRNSADFGPPGSRGDNPRATDAAAYVQAQTEQALSALAEQTIAATGLRNLCFAGGVALNCVAADRLRRLDAVDGYFAPPASSDRGQALGCALHAWHQLTGELPRRPLTHDYFGRTYTDAEIKQALTRDPRSGLVERRRTPYRWRRESNITATAAQMITAGNIIGWFQGGSELGPRALGGRSILADPRTTASSHALNHRIKHREPFRPFAPAVLAAHAHHWFDLDVPSPFMLLAPPVRADRADTIAGVVHVDRTARVQTVDPSTTPAFASLIEHVHQLTGVPLVLNTSLNTQEPIVETPAHALATFQACGLDALCIGDYLVEPD